MTGHGSIVLVNDGAANRNADAIRSPGEFRASVGSGQPGTGVPVVEALF